MLTLLAGPAAVRDARRTTRASTLPLRAGRPGSPTEALLYFPCVHTRDPQ